MDLTTLVVIAGVFLGVVVGDAALYGDTLLVQMQVPAKLSQSGFTSASAEQLFAAEVERVNHTVSPAPAPNLHMSTRPTVLTALAKPLSLDGVVVAIQSQIGVDVVSVNGTIIADPTGNGLDMITVVIGPKASPIKFHLSQPDGNAEALVEQASRRVLERIEPYRLALTDLTEGLSGNPALLAQAKQVAMQALTRPWATERAWEHSMLHDTLAILALVDGDIADAETQFRAADAVPHAMPVVHGVVALNRAFIAVTQRRPTDALAFYQTGLATTTDVSLPGVPTLLATMHALVVWSGGDTKQAEQLLRAASAASPDAEEPHHYLAELLAANGDAAGAAREQAAAADAHRSTMELASLAASVFWTDPVHGGMQLRKP